MRQVEIPSSLISEIDPKDIEKYVQFIGWKQVPGKRQDIAIYRHPSHDYDEIQIPLTRKFADYAEGVARALLTLSRAEKKELIAVVDDVLYGPSDVVQFQLSDPSFEDGTVSLQEGLNLFNGAKKALIASVCSVIRPQHHHPRMHGSAVESFVKNCRLGQTERGSFIVNFICPLSTMSPEDTPIQLAIHEVEEPFTRLVTKTLMGSLQDLISSIEKDRSDYLFAPDQNMVVSANLCDALSAMQPDGIRSSLTIHCNWAGKGPIDNDIPTSIKIPKSYFPSIEKVGIQLRQPATRPEKTIYIGKIEELRGEPGDDGRMQGEVIFSFIAEDELLRAQVFLKPDDYQKAIKAHANASTMFAALQGIIQLRSRLHAIVEYDWFHALDQSQLQSQTE